MKYDIIKMKSKKNVRVILKCAFASLSVISGILGAGFSMSNIGEQDKTLAALKYVILLILFGCSFKFAKDTCDVSDSINEINDIIDYERIRGR